jgi:ribose transport system substrate-binding protein
VPTAPGCSIQIHPAPVAEFAFRGESELLGANKAVRKEGGMDVKTRLIGALLAVGLTGALTTAALATTARTAKHTAALKVGVSLAGYSTDFWSSYVAFEKAAASKYGVSLTGPIAANGDAGKQATQIRTLISQGVKALIVNPVDSAAIAPSLAYAASKHVPVVSVDVAPSKGNVYMIVSADNIKMGASACEYVGKHASGAGTVAMLQGDLASVNGKYRSDGFTACAKAKYPNLKIVKYATKWDTPTAVNDAKTALSTYSDLKAIYAHWSGPIPGIIEAEKAAGKFKKVGEPGHILLVAIDGTPQEHANIREGVQDATVSQPANLYAQYAVFYATQAVKGVKYKPGKTTHGSKIVRFGGNLMDALVAQVVDKSNVNNPTFWGAKKR